MPEGEDCRADAILEVGFCQLPGRSARSRRISIRVGMYVGTYVCIDCGTKKNKGTAIYRIRISERSPASRATATTRVASQLLKGIDRDYSITSIVTA